MTRGVLRYFFILIIRDQSFLMPGVWMELNLEEYKIFFRQICRDIEYFPDFL